MEAAPRPDETLLVEALRAGDETAFEQVTREFSPVMLRVAQMYVSSRAVAEEVVQETWLGVLEGIERFEGRSSLKTWIFRILTNTAKTRAVREGRTLPLSSLAGADDPQEPALEADRFHGPDHPWPGHWTARPAVWSALPEERLLAGETRERLADALEGLPPNQRAVVTLRDVHGWSSEEVCNALSLSETNQRVLLHRGRSRMRSALERYLDQEGSE